MTESARSIPVKSAPEDGVDAAATPYAPSTWSQMPRAFADLGERVDLVDGPGERGSGGRDHGDRRDTARDVRVDRLGDRIRTEPPMLVEGKRPHAFRAEPEELRGTDDRVVRLSRAVDSTWSAMHAVVP